MTPTQIKYARERLAEINRERMSAVGKGGPQFTPADRHAALKAGEFTVRKKLAGNGHYLDDYVDFGERVAQSKAWEREKAAKLKALAKEYSSAKDRLILGDEQQALSLLEEFRKGTE